MEPTVARFTALARSSPWRWTALRFVLETRRFGKTQTVRGWIGRPDRLRVERLDGTLLVAERRQPPSPVYLTAAVPRPSSGAPGGRFPAWYSDAPDVGLDPVAVPGQAPPTGPADLSDPADPSDPAGRPAPPPAAPPTFDADGLVSTPRAWSDRATHDAPMWQDYRWVAMFDPAELADGVDEDAPVVVDALTAVEHHGRPAWEAVVRTTPAYDPRCSCCPLLLSADSDAWEVGGGQPPLTERRPGLRFADAHLVRLDVATGVCVSTAEIGGDRPGDGHDLRIEEVDGPVP